MDCSFYLPTSETVTEEETTNTTIGLQTEQWNTTSYLSLQFRLPLA